MTERRWARYAGVVAAGLLVAAGCGREPDPGDDPGAGTEPDTLYQVSATVLEDQEHGPQLCHGVLDSYPPQCGGPDIVGWDWTGLDAESAEGTTWGEYRLVGTWDGERFVLARPPEPIEPPDQDIPGDPDGERVGTPCQEPPDGWEPVDEDLATNQALDEAIQLAESAPDYAGAWVDQAYLDEYDFGPNDPRMEEVANDPARLVLNVSFTGNLVEREQWLREVWGGALCVSEAEHTEDELLDVQRRLHDDFPDEILGSGIDTRRNVLEAEVYVASRRLQDAMDDQYGEGVVVLSGWLQPVPS